MDVVSHAVWGATIIRKSTHVWWAAFFGALPDLLTGAYGLVRYGSKYSVELIEFSELHKPGGLYLKVYYFFHSFLPISIVAGIIAIFAPNYTIVTLPYYLHIIMDIFTHRGVWATRIFYPISNFHFQGHNWWKNKWISIVNWGAIVAINLIIFIL
ncbi:hypothetical protein KKF61_00635 [Patescibacteria group bacterium]|nr:hypothetical protein [Patescibacteria group bacterium]MBU0964016.1 hypothetical protein [Patescibacteria group bacterium]